MANTYYQDFVASQESMKGPPHPEQLSALESLFSDSTPLVSEVATKINGPYFKAIQENPGNRSNPAERQCARIWRTINNAVKQLPKLNGRLAELVFEMLQISDRVCADICLHHFNQEWAEFAWNFKQPLFTDPDREVKVQAWVSMNTFCARLSTYGNPKLDMLSDADWIIRQALERTPWEVYDQRDIDKAEDLEDDGYSTSRQYELEKRDIRSLNYWILGAAPWFKVNCAGIYQLDGPMAHEHDWSPTNWKGPKGWSKKRFAYWIERFEWISEVTALDQNTRGLASEVAEIMKRVEGNVLSGS